MPLPGSADTGDGRHALQSARLTRCPPPPGVFPHFPSSVRFCDSCFDFSRDSDFINTNMAVVLRNVDGREPIETFDILWKGNGGSVFLVCGSDGVLACSLVPSA